MSSTFCSILSAIASLISPKTTSSISKAAMVTVQGESLPRKSIDRSGGGVQPMIRVLLAEGQSCGEKTLQFHSSLK